MSNCTDTSIFIGECPHRLLCGHLAMLYKQQRTCSCLSGEQGLWMGQRSSMDAATARLLWRANSSRPRTAWTLSLVRGLA